jgi:hypothetical protein
VRLSLHPTTTDAEVRYFLGAISEIVANHREWSADYRYDKHTNEFIHKDCPPADYLNEWFSMDLQQQPTYGNY